MPTAQVIVESAMRKAGLLESGESASTNEQADGLEALNDLLDAWSSSGWIVPYRTRDEDLAVATSSNSYSIGSGGDFNVARPSRIFSVTVTSGGSDYVLKERGVKDYNLNKTSSQDIPEFFYYEPTYATGTLYFPSKLGTSMTVTIDSLKPFTAFSLISTDISFPDGYVPALKYNLAVDFAAEFGVEVPQSVAFRAEQYLDFIRTQSRIHRKQTVEIDPAIRTTSRRRFDVVTNR